MRNFRRVTPVRAVPLTAIFVFFFAPAFSAQAPAASVEDWSAAAQTFERKIAEKLKPGQSVTLSLQNMSSLSPDETALVRKDIEMEWRAQGRQVKANGRKAATASEEGVAEIRVTLAENSQGLLWVAEIRQQENRDVVMLALPRAVTAGSSASIPAMLLRSQMLLEQEAPILDFALIELPSGSPTELLVLEPARVALYSLDLHSGDQVRLQLRQAAALPASDSPQRALHGSLRIIQDSFLAILPGKSCGGLLRDTLAVKCAALAPGPWDNHDGLSLPDPSAEMRRDVSSFSVARIEGKGKRMEIDAGADGLARLYNSDDRRGPIATFTGWGSDIAGIKSGCGSGWQILVTRTGDWTERDAVQAFEIDGKRAVAVSPALEFAGPVLVLQASENKDTGLAVVRNLQTGRYEAHVLSLSCGR
jgi:hypothetical protein